MGKTIDQISYKPDHFVPADKVMDELKKYMLVDGYDLVPDMIESKTPFFRDKRTGKDYYDFFTCFASMPLGMNHPKLKTEKFMNYMKHSAVNKLSNSDIYTEEMATFVKTFFETAVPEHFIYSFYISGGALAVENALKAAFDWKVRKNFAKGYKEEKGHKIIHFKQAFHGRTGYTMSLTNTDPNKVKYFPKFDWPRVDNPYLHFPLNENSLDDVIEREKRAIAQIKQAFAENKDDIAGIIIEPIQGEGGDNHFRNDFLQELKQLAIENDALLIFDEVQTGLGLTGTYWAHQQMGVEPDIMAFGKKMQVCGILAGDRLDEVEDNVFHTSSRINSTWGGNLVDMVRSTRYLEIIHEEDLIDNVNVMSDVLRGRMRSLRDQYPDKISNVRGRGLFSAFDLENAELRNKLLSRSYENGLMILGCGVKTIRFRPPLNINADEINAGFDLIDRSMKEIF